MPADVLGAAWYCAALRRASALLDALAERLERPGAGAVRLALEPLAPPCHEDRLQDLRHRIEARYY